MWRTRRSKAVEFVLDAVMLLFSAAAYPLLLRAHACVVHNAVRLDIWVRRRPGSSLLRACEPRQYRRTNERA